MATDAILLGDQLPGRAKPPAQAPSAAVYLRKYIALPESRRKLVPAGSYTELRASVADIPDLEPRGPAPLIEFLEDGRIEGRPSFKAFAKGLARQTSGASEGDDSHVGSGMSPRLTDVSCGCSTLLDQRDTFSPRNTFDYSPDEQAVLEFGAEGQMEDVVNGNVEQMQGKDQSPPMSKIGGVSEESVLQAEGEFRQSFESRRSARPMSGLSQCSPRSRSSMGTSDSEVQVKRTPAIESFCSYLEKLDKYKQRSSKTPPHSSRPLINKSARESSGTVAGSAVKALRRLREGGDSSGRQSKQCFSGRSTDTSESLQQERGSSKTRSSSFCGDEDAKARVTDASADTAGSIAAVGSPQPPTRPRRYSSQDRPGGAHRKFVRGSAELERLPL